MRVAFDIEADGLTNPKNIWVIVCKDISSGSYHIFREVTSNEAEASRFAAFASTVEQWIGHNILGYDCRVILKLLGIDLGTTYPRILDTLVLSKLVDYPRQGHSIKDYGIEFGLNKGDHRDFSKYSTEMETYCIRDVDICQLIVRKYLRYINNSEHVSALALEHDFEALSNLLSDRGFAFNTKRATTLLDQVTGRLAELDKEILEAFPPKLRLIKEITPKETKHGTLSLSDFRWLKSDSVVDITEFNGGPFCRCEWTEFNPSSHKQILQVLSEALWSPVEKTQTHIDTEREYNKLRYVRFANHELDLRRRACYDKLQLMRKTGWKVNEANLDTLPVKAPKATRLLAQRILYESRRRTLTEWLDLVQPDGRIHGKFYAIGTWTHRMAHQAPNTANIPNEFDLNNKRKLLGKELRSLWMAPKGRLLAGVDAEAIQLRIFAHYINDKEFTDALVRGKKDDKTDPHSLNQRILGSVCQSRAAAKRFIFALLLGAGIGKLAQILDSSEASAQEGLDRILQRYTGFAELKQTIIPKDAARGWFRGLDGRSVRILGDTEGARRHLAMSGYLQNGEAVVIKTAAVIAAPKLVEEDAFLVNIIHDELQAEVPNDFAVALRCTKIMKDAIKSAGEMFNLRCPLAGSDWNDDHKDYTIGMNWSVTH